MISHSHDPSRNLTTGERSIGNMMCESCCTNMMVVRCVMGTSNMCPSPRSSNHHCLRSNVKGSDLTAFQGGGFIPVGLRRHWRSHVRKPYFSNIDLISTESLPSCEAIGLIENRNSCPPSHLASRDLFAGFSGAVTNSLNQGVPELPLHGSDTNILFAYLSCVPFRFSKQCCSCLTSNPIEVMAREPPQTSTN